MKIWYLPRLYVVRRYRNRKVTFRPYPPGVPSGQTKVKFQFLQKLVEFIIRLIRQCTE